MEYISREEAEEIIQSAIEDYLSDITLTEILDLIYPDEYIVVDGENITEAEDEE